MDPLAVATCTLMVPRTIRNKLCYSMHACICNKLVCCYLLRALAYFIACDTMMVVFDSKDKR